MGIGTTVTGRPGAEMRRVRSARGWSQADLARHLGVGQQAVSRWERGRGAPAAGLQAEVQRLLEGLAVGPVASRPLLPRLPFDQLLPRDFERFAVDLTRAEHPSGSVDVAYLWGSAGHTQDGIDALGLAPDGSWVAVQCKQVARFGAAKVHSAVHLVEERFTAPPERPIAEFRLYLSRTASPKARTALAEHAGWTLRDADDLSAAVRALPPERAVHLVDVYFPRQREDFLGVRAPSPWLTAAEFAPRAALAMRLLAQPAVEGRYQETAVAALRLVGRSAEIAALKAALVGDDTVVLLIGAGGAGKSRLLTEVDKHTSGVPVRYLLRDQNVRPEDFELLPPASSLVLVIDDADRRGDLQMVLLRTLTRVPDARFVLGVRPGGVKVVENRVQSALGWSAVVVPVPMGELTVDEAGELVELAGGGRLERSIVKRLAEAARDCPALLVVGAAAATRNRLTIAPITGAVALRADVQTVFPDVVGEVAGTGEPPVRQVLTAVAALQPVRWGREAFDAALADLSDLRGQELEVAVARAERRGLVLSRGDSFRVVPDLLGDALLAEACRPRPGGASSAFFRKLVALDDDEVLAHALDNAARLDWQEGLKDTVSDALWDAMQARYSSAAPEHRATLIGAATRAAVHRPDRALRFAQLVLEEPAMTPDDSSSRGDGGLAASQAWAVVEVRRAVPLLLRAAARDADQVAAAAELLWDLARVDDRLMNQHPGHPVRVLQELASLEPDKPLIVNQRLFEQVAAWARQHDQRHRPAATCLDLLAPLLATEGDTTTFDGAVLTVRRHSYQHSSVAEVRARIIGLALDHARSSDLRLAAAAVRLLDAALAHRKAPRPEQEWATELLITMDSLRELAADPQLDPAVAVLVRRIARRHARFGTGREQEAAQRVLEALPSSVVHRVACEVQGIWSDWLDDPEDWQAEQVAHEEEVRQLICAFLAERGPDGALDIVLQQVRAARSVADPSTASVSPGTPWNLAAVLTDESPVAGESLLKRASAAARARASGDGDELELLLPLIPAALGRLASASDGSHGPGGQAAVAQARGLLELDAMHGEAGGHRLAGAVAQGLGVWRGRRDGLLTGERQVLETLLQHPAPLVVTEAVRGLRVLAHRDPALVASLIHLVDLDPVDEVHVPPGQYPAGAGQSVLSELLLLVGSRGPLSWDSVPALRNMLDDALVRVATVDDFAVTEALLDISRTDPHRVVDVLIARCERQEARVAVRYRALPMMPRLMLPIRETSAFHGLLGRALDWAAEDSNNRHLLGSDLFAALAGAYDDQVIAVLRHRLRNGAPSDVTVVAAALAAAPQTLLWDRVEVVEDLLTQARLVGNDAQAKVQRALHACAVGTSRSGLVGEPYVEDVERRDQGRAVLQKIGRYSSAWSLYKQLLSGAEEAIAEETRHDWTPRDGRRW